MLTGLAFAQNSLPFTKGVNLCNFMEYWGNQEDALPTMNKYDEADFVCLKSMGVEAIRLPIHFELLMEPMIQELFMILFWKNWTRFVIGRKNTRFILL